MCHKLFLKGLNSFSPNTFIDMSGSYCGMLSLQRRDVFPLEGISHYPSAHIKEE